MHTFELALHRPLPDAWRAFCDLSRAHLWLPGVKKLRVVRTDAQGRPLEVLWEFGDSLSYALVYAYDDVHHQVRWVPSAGVQDGVSGAASFTATPAGCLFRYHLESLRGRAVDHPEAVARAFAAWVNAPGALT
jgi:hypothetical protein